MNILKKLISNLKSRKYSTTKLRERYAARDYTYLKKAFLHAPNYLKVQAVEYLGTFSNQENLDFLIDQFKRQKDEKLKAYTYGSILIIAQNEKLNLAKSDEMLLSDNLDLLDNIGVVRDIPTKQSTSTPISFRNKLKDHLQELEDKKRTNRIY